MQVILIFIFYFIQQVTYMVKR